MDRNQAGVELSTPALVALRKESVDRNRCPYPSGTGRSVALRKESVDRNRYKTNVTAQTITSLSARRAWIEICGRVAQRICGGGRSPQGERG